MYWKGNLISNTSVSKRRSLGIEVVYQERALIDQQSVWKNIFMGRELTNFAGLLLSKKMRQETYR
jgi:simple sugar transport system ATP-binding protein